MNDVLTPARILLTGSRDWDDPRLIREALEFELQGLPVTRPVVLVHGAHTSGADKHGDDIWREWRHKFPFLFEPPERHHARSFDSPLDRNDYMVGLGAYVCLAFATRWASGTGHCARAARRAGIRTVDHGVSTRIEDRPASKGSAA